MSGGKIGLEQHVDRILKGDEIAWKNYKRHLACMHTFLNKYKSPYINIEEGDSYIRLQPLSDNCNLNKFYFLFEIGDFFPQIRWRNLIKKSLTLSPVLLHRRACFLPVYSFSFDRFLTLIYWGEKQPLFDPEQLKKFDIKSFLFMVPHPSSTFISAANFTWLKSIEKMWYNSKSILELCKSYIFNALYPPDLLNNFDPWHEAPFILINDRSLEIFTIHKTICYLDLYSSRESKIEHFLKLKGCILDNKLNVKKVYCLIPREYVPLLEKNPMKEVIIVKYMKVYDKESARKPIFEIFLYPFESSLLFNDETPELLITTASIILRHLYLNSPDPLKLQATPEEIRHKILSIFHYPPFNKYEWDTLISCLFQHVKGVAFILQTLSVYYATKDELFYFHPSIIETLSILYEDFDRILDMNIENLKHLLTQLLEVFIYIKRYQEKIYKFNQVMDLRENIKKILGFYVTSDTVRRFTLSLIMMWENIIPISKILFQPKPLQSYEYKLEVK